MQLHSGSGEWQVVLLIAACRTGTPQSRYEQYYALPIGRKKNQQRKEVSLPEFHDFVLHALTAVI